MIDPGTDIRGVVDAEPDDGTPAVVVATDEIATEAARRDDREDTDAKAARPSAATVAADELPIPDYDTLPVRGVVVALRTLTDEGDLTAVEEYERGHKNRAGVLTAVQNRTEALAHDTTNG